MQKEAGVVNTPLFLCHILLSIVHISERKRPMKLKRLVSLLLAAVCSFSCLSFVVGCEKAGNPGEQGIENAEKNDTAPDAGKMVIVSGGKSEYTVVRMEEYSETVRRKLKEVVDAIKEVTGVELEYTDGFVKHEEDIDPDAKELVFGKCDSVNYADYMQGVDYLSCVLRTVKNRIVFAGWSDMLSGYAADRFIDLVRANGKEGELIIDRPDMVFTPEPAAEESNDKFGEFMFTYYHGPTPREMLADETIIQDLIALGYTHITLHEAGVEYDEVQAAIEQCAKYGMKVIVHLMYIPRYEDSIEGGGNYDDAKIRKRAEQINERYGGYDNLVAYYLVDEPAYADIDIIGKIADDLHEIDPTRPLIVNLNPGNYADDWDMTLTGVDEETGAKSASCHYNVESYLTVGQSDVASFDTYVFEGNGNLNDAPAFKGKNYFDHLLGNKRLAAKYGLPAAMYMQTWSDSTHYRPTMHIEQERWLFNTILAHGYGQINTFTYSFLDTGGIVDQDNNPTELYYAVQEIAKEYVPLGQYMYDLRFEHAAHLNTHVKVDAPEYVGWGWLGEIGRKDENDGAVIGFFEGDIFYLVNFEYRSVTESSEFILGDYDGSGIEWYDQFAGEWKPAEQSERIGLDGGAYTVSLEPGAAVLLRVVD